MKGKGEVGKFHVHKHMYKPVTDPDGYLPEQSSKNREEHTNTVNPKRQLPHRENDADERKVYIYTDSYILYCNSPSQPTLVYRIVHE